MEAARFFRVRVLLRLMRTVRQPNEQIGAQVFVPRLALSWQVLFSGLHKTDVITRASQPDGISCVELVSRKRGKRWLREPASSQGIANLNCEANMWGA